MTAISFKPSKPNLIALGLLATVLIVAIVFGLRQLFVQQPERSTIIDTPSPVPGALTGIIQTQTETTTRLWRATSNGIVEPLAEFAATHNNPPTSLFLNSLPLIYTHGTGNFGFTLTDLTGRNVTEQFQYFTDQSLPATNTVPFSNNPDRILYFPSQDETPTSRRSTPPTITIKNTRSGESIPLAINALAQKIATTRLLGWSHDQQYFYVSQLNPETFTYAGLWKVQPDSKEATLVPGTNRVSLGKLSVLPAHDLAVGIMSEHEPCDTCPGQTQDTAPSSLYLFNLNQGTSSILTTDSVHPLARPVLSPTGNIVFFEQVISSAPAYSSRLLMIEVKRDAEPQLIGDNLRIHSLSEDGQHLLVASANATGAQDFRILDLATRTETALQWRGEKPEYITPLGCNYSLSFSCLYAPSE